MSFSLARGCERQGQWGDSDIEMEKFCWASKGCVLSDSAYKKEEYGPDKYTIRRYQKYQGEYKPKSKFNISSAAQAEKIIEALQGWLK